MHPGRDRRGAPARTRSPCFRCHDPMPECPPSRTLVMLGMYRGNRCQFQLHAGSGGEFPELNYMISNNFVSSFRRGAARFAVFTATAFLLPLCALAAGAPAASAIAFPGAVGYAAHTAGGRGGQIIRVTTLASDGPGSLAAALETKGPRVIVFEVGGVIDLQMRELKITEPFLTVAGQTAPSPGITLIRTGFDILTHDVILQHIRSRTGSGGNARQGRWDPDAISTVDAYNIIVDHCSMTWAIDENLSASGPRFTGA